IAAYLGTFPSLFSQIKLYSLDVKVRGQEAAVNWRLRFKTKTGNVFFLEGIGFFKFNQEGKIQSEREFFDLAAFLPPLHGWTSGQRSAQRSSDEYLGQLTASSHPTVEAWHAPASTADQHF